MTKPKTKQLNIRVSIEQYEVLLDIVRKSEFPTTAQGVATSLLKKLLDERAAKNAS